MLIDLSYFNGNLLISNTDRQATAETVQWFINKHEPEFLQKLMGYELYKAFTIGMSAISPATPDQRYLDLLYGCEYINYQGRTSKWKGLIVTSSPVFNVGGNFVYKRPDFMTVGVTAGLVPNSTTYTNVDWIGWTPILFREILPMVPGVDYNYDVSTGTVTLLIPGDKFTNERILAEFQLRTDAVPIVAPVGNFSCIANYIYFNYMKVFSTRTTKAGEAKSKVDNVMTVSPRAKIIQAWNEMHYWVEDFGSFMYEKDIISDPVYPEFTDSDRRKTLREFCFINPIF